MFLSRPHPYLAILAAAACVGILKCLVPLIPSFSGPMGVVFDVCMFFGPASLATWLARLHEENLRQRVLMSLACGAAASFALIWADDLSSLEPSFRARPVDLAEIAVGFAICTVVYTLSVLVVSILAALWHRRRAARRTSPT